MFTSPENQVQYIVYYKNTRVSYCIRAVRDSSILSVLHMI
jgi:hypothetical protein